jgi:spermidine/putrescine transport system ATP-binding protein
MDGGRIEQVGTPAEIYEAPRTSFVAAFIGDTNFLDGTVLGAGLDGGVRVEVPGLPEIGADPGKAVAPGQDVHLSIRPEKIRISRERPEAAPGRIVVPAVVEDVIYLGASTRIWVKAGGRRIQVVRQQLSLHGDEAPIRWKDEVWIWWQGADGFMIDRFRRDDEKLVAAPPTKVGEET